MSLALQPPCGPFTFCAEPSLPRGPDRLEWTHAEVIARADDILRQAGINKNHVLQTNFLDYADTVRDVVKDWARDRIFHNRGFLEALKRLRDDFEEVVRRDPGCLYTPANATALAFHKSLARTRYFHGGNRISKTQSAAQDNYWVLTRQHPYRPLPPVGGSVFVIGTDYQNYGPKTFVTKYIYGENGNPLSPLFPEDGKWFYHYDERKHILTVACPDCAKADKAQSCPGHHIKPTLTLYSDMGRPQSIAGAAFAQGQLDEQIGYGFWAECLKRINTVPNSGLVVTETPILGRAWWTYPILKLAAKRPPEENIIPGTNRPIIEVFTCSAYDGGLVPKAEIDADAQQMTEPERRARIFGEHVAASESAIFDLPTLLQMREECREPVKGTLYIEAETPFGLVREDSSSNEKNATALLGLIKEKDAAWIHFRADEAGFLNIFEPAARNTQYFITADVAKGLTKGDFSCADVWKVVQVGMDLCIEQVAQYHGWINSSEYGCELMKLAIQYNSAPLVIERTGPGDATINKVRELGYWNLYQDLNAPAATRLQFGHLYGVDTNISTKPVMVALLQSCIKDRATGRRSLSFRCEASIEELENYIQEPSESGKTITFHAAGTMKDDRVMSAAIGAFVLKTNPGAVYSYTLAQKYEEQKLVDKRDWITKKFWDKQHKSEARARAFRARHQRVPHA